MKRPIQYVVYAAVVVAVFVMSNYSLADWRCPCGTIVHVNYPTTCPTCNRDLPNIPPIHSRPNSSPAPDASGLVFGATLSNIGGLVTVRQITGLPALGSLFPNDKLIKGAFRDSYTGRVTRVQFYSPQDMIRLKTLAGADQRVALQVWREGVGYRSFYLYFGVPGGIYYQDVVQTNERGKTIKQAYTREAKAGSMDEIPMSEVRDLLGDDARESVPEIINGGSIPPYNESPDDLLNEN